MNRREFLQLSSLLPALSFAPSVFANTAKPLLLLVELKGANDGLNTLVPVEDANYHRLRPTIALGNKDTIPVGNGFAMHKAMQPLMTNWNNGDMAWLHGLGYKNPNRSHFRSIEIWESGSDSDIYDMEGWVAKLFPESADALKAVILGSDYGPLAGAKFDSLIMEDTKSFQRLAKRLKAVRQQSSNSALSRILDVQNNIHQNASTIIKTLEDSKALSTKFPHNKFGKQLEQAAHLINNKLPANLYKVELGGFDTHSGQIRRHTNLLSQLSQALAAFTEAMKASGQWDNILIMTYSEFGRRVSENKSGGTDHGTAAAHFVMGGRIRGGFHGIAPSLDQLDNNGDLIHTADFRSLYNTVASQWLKTPSPWTNHQAFNLIKS